MNTITNLNTFPIGNSLDGVNIITEEINTLSLLVDGTNSMLADLNMNNHVIKNLEAGVDSQDAVNKSQLDLKADTTYVNIQDNLRVLKSGDSMTGSLNMNSTNKIINLANGTANGDAVNRSQLNTKADTTYVNTQDALRLKRDGTDIMTGNLNMNSNKIINVANGTNTNDAVNYSQLSSLSSDIMQDLNDLELYVDSSLNLLRNDLTDDINDLKSYTDSSLNLLRNDLTDDINDLKTYTDSSLNTLKSYVDSQDNLKLNIAGDTMTGVLNLTQATNTRNIVIKPKQEQYGTGGGGSGIRYNYVRFNYDGADPSNNAGGRQWCISSQNDAGVSDSNALYLRCGSGGTDVTRYILGHTKTYMLNPVGIGTENPTEKLDVNGTAIIRGSLNMNSTNKIINLENGTNPNDAVNFSQLTDLRDYTDASLNLKVNKAGDTMTGALNITELTDSPNTNKQVNVTNNNHGIWFNPRFGPGSYNPLVSNGGKGMIFSNGTKETGELVIGPWSDSYNGIKLIGSSGNVGIGAENPSEKLDVNGTAIIRDTTTINKNANFFINLNVSSSQTIDIKSGNALYDRYTLTYTGLGTEFRLPYLTQTDTTLQNKTIAFKITGSTEVILSPLPLTGSFTTIRVDGVDYVSTVLRKSSSFILKGGGTIGEYTTHDYQEYTSTDQLTIKTNLGTDANSEFTGIRFLNTNTNAGYLRVETNLEHTNSTMIFKVRQSNSIVTPLEINNFITAYKPIIRKEWSSGELIQQRIYNQDTNNTGVKTIDKNGTAWVNWKEITFDMNHTPTDTIVAIEVNAPWVMEGWGNDEALIRVTDEGTTIFESSLNWNDAGGGGSRAMSLMPILASWTPSGSTSSRTLKVDFYNGADDNLYICSIIDPSRTRQNKNYYTIRVSEYKK